MSTKSQTLLLILDVQATVDVAELEALVDQAPRETLRLSAFGAPTWDGPATANWASYGGAVEKLVAHVAEIERVVGRPLDVYVAGRAPLALFVHLGFSLQRFTGRQVVLQHDGTAWKPLALATVPVTPTFFDRLSGLDVHPRSGTGRTALYVDTAGRPATVDSIRRVLDDHGESLVDVVEMSTTASVALTAENVGAMAQDLVREIPRVPSLYPYARGVAIFVAGPTVLAFAVGRSLTQSIFSSIWLTNGAPPNYQLVYPLPFTSVVSRSIGQDDADKAERERVHDLLMAGITDLKTTLEPADMLAPSDKSERLISRLRSLNVVDTGEKEFRLSIVEQKLAFGVGLLEGLRGAAEEALPRFGQLLLLHELWHVDQELRSTNYYEVGRAGVVLEHIDYAADVFSVRALLQREHRRAGPNSDAAARDILASLIDVVIFGIEAFDRQDQPTKIDPLPERRLRRYLTWHLQAARAATVRTWNDADALLISSVAAELAPVAGRLDDRFDKVVSKALATTELFVAVDGILVRQARRPGIEPSALVDAVRTYNRTIIDATMRALVDGHQRVLAPWVP